MQGPEGVASTNVSYLKKASTSYKALVALVKTDAAVPPPNRIWHIYDSQGQI